MYDNITVNGRHQIVLLEDVGNQAHLGKVWRYDIAIDTLTQVASLNPARFGNIGIPATTPFNQDEESSGVINVSSIPGEGWYLLDVQAHSATDAELVEGGQFLALHIPPGKK